MNVQFNKNWLQFKEKFVETHKDLDPKLLDYIAVYDILRLVVNGMSNIEVADLMGCSTDYIEKTNFEFLGILGYKETLEFSPLQQYKRFKELAIATGGNGFSDMCDRYLDIERKVEEYYARN